MSTTGDEQTLYRAVSDLIVSQEDNADSIASVNATMLDMMSNFDSVNKAVREDERLRGIECATKGSTQRYFK